MSEHFQAGSLLAIVARLSPFLGDATIRAARQPERGYGGGANWIVELSNGRSCFIKAALDERTAEGLRTEYRVYSELDADFLPRLLWWDDAGLPLLVIEDLSNANWPPLWNARRIEQVLDLINRVHRISLLGLPRILRTDPGWEGWDGVAADPARFLSLGLCSATWLSQSLSRLLQAVSSVTWETTHFVHNDLHGYNLCFRANRPILIDWSSSGVGSPMIDLMGWLPSLEAEGGPRPEEILSGRSQNEGGWAALYSGYYARHAKPHTPQMINLNLLYVRTALPWAVRALGLSPLDGPNAP